MDKYHFSRENLTRSDETQAKVMTDTLWITAPSVIDILTHSPKSNLNHPDKIVLSTVQEVLSVIKHKPAIGQSVETTFESQSQEEPIPSTQTAQESNYQDPSPQVLEYIKGTAEVKVTYDEKNYEPDMQISVDFAEVLGDMALPDNLPTRLHATIIGTFDDTVTTKITDQLPSIFIYYHLHTPKGLIINYFNILLAPATLDPEAIEERLLESQVYSTNQPPLTAILNKTDLETKSEATTNFDGTVDVGEIIHHLGTHKIPSIPGDTQVFFTNNSESNWQVRSM